MSKWRYIKAVAINGAVVVGCKYCSNEEFVNFGIAPEDWNCSKCGSKPHILPSGVMVARLTLDQEI